MELHILVMLKLKILMKMKVKLVMKDIHLANSVELLMFTPEKGLAKLKDNCLAICNIQIGFLMFII